MQWCAFNHPVCLSERSVYLWCRFVHVACTPKCLGEWHEARIVQIVFSTAIDRVNNQGIHYKLCSVGIGVSVLFYWQSFYQIDHNMLWWTCRSKLVNVVSGVPQLFWARYCSSCTPRTFLHFGDKLIAFDDDPTLIAVCHPYRSELQ